MAAEDGCGCLTHVAVVLSCSKPTLKSWIKRHPSLREAIMAGRLVGEKFFREKLAKHAFEPTSTVNNGLIKLLGANVHDIREEDGPQVVINNSNETVVNTGEETSRLYEAAKAKIIPINP
jgi:hypothetical protein